MLTKDDLKQINEVVSKVIKQGFADFYEGIFEPYATKNENEHAEMKGHILEIRDKITLMDNDLEEVKEYIKDHDQRIEKLEAVTPLNN